MKHDVGQHVFFIETWLGAHLRLKKSAGHKKVQQRSPGGIGGLLLVGSLIGNIRHLQKACVGKVFGSSGKVQDSEIESWFQREGNVQSCGIGFHIQFYLGETSGLFEGIDGVLDAAVGVGFTGLELD